MNIQPKLRYITTNEYSRMGELGIFKEDERIELIEGEIFEMTPIGIKHVNCVNRLTEYFVKNIPDSVMVSIQNPIYLGEYSEPQPDILLIRRKEYYKLPNPDDIFLIIEVAESSVDYDRETKIPLYAKSGIKEVWLIDLNNKCIEIYQEPSSFGYDSISEKYSSDNISPLTFPEIKVDVEYVF